MRPNRPQRRPATPKPPPHVPGHNALAIERLAIASLKLPPQALRKHPKRQVAKLAKAISTFGFNAPVLIDDANVIVAGVARVEAAKSLGLVAVPCIRLSHLNDAQIRAFRIADNRISELASWDDEMLGQELKILTNLDLEFDLEATGFDIGEIDLRLETLDGTAAEANETDEGPVAADLGPPVAEPGDLFVLGRHRLLCADALDPASYERLLQGEEAAMIFTDPPFNVRINGHAGGLGAIQHREFAMASGEMSKAEFEAMLTKVMRLMARNSRSGSIHMIAMDWRHAHDLLNAGSAIYTELKNICVWAKHSGGMGSFYRSQHEFFFVFKHGKAPHRNNFRLGETGRYRTNVWSYPGVGGFGAASEDGNLLALHPTVKPTALVADAILDVSAPNEWVLDPFAGSGTTMLAAERTGRRAAAIEIDPRYVDVAIRRWQRHTGGEAVLESTGETFNARARKKNQGT